MRQTLRRAVRPTVVMAGLLALGMATPARADLEIHLSTSGTSWTTAAYDTSGGVASYGDKSFSGFNISVLSDDSNSPGSPSLAYLEGSSVHITNNNAGVATLYIMLSDTGFTSPVTSVDAIVLDSQIGGSVTVPGSHNRLCYQTYVDPQDGQGTLSGFTPGPQAPNITGSPKSYSSDATTPITKGLTTTYSITESFKITLDKGSQIGFQSSTSLSYTPEPSGLALAGVGALGLIGYGLRRRKARGTSAHPIDVPGATRSQ